MAGEGGEGGGGGGGGGGGDSIPASVQARIDRISEQRRTAEARATDLEGKLAQANEKAGKYDAAMARIADYEKKEAAWGDERVIMGAGITDPDGVDFARLAWGRVPADHRPAGGLKEWLGKPDALPKAVRAYLPEAPASSGGASGGQVGAGGGASGGTGGNLGLPPSNRGTVPTSPGGQPKLTPAEIAAMPIAEYQKHRDDILSGKR